MTVGVGGLVAAYLAVGTILVGLGLYSRWPWQVKAAGVVITTAAYLVLYHSFPPILGWPTQGELPGKFDLLSVYIQEPDRITDSQGDIFFWAVNLEEGAERTPRAYRMAFTPELKATFREAAGKLKKNMPQLGNLEPEEGSMGVPWREGKQTGQKSVKIDFQDMPRGESCPKDDPNCARAP